MSQYNPYSEEQFPEEDLEQLLYDIEIDLREGRDYRCSDIPSEADLYNVSAKLQKKARDLRKWCDGR